jgi:hypothetical protein
MYYSIYTSDENEQLYLYNNLINKNINQEKFCIICWSKGETNDQLYFIKDFNKYIVSCNCNVLMHFNCLHEWIEKTNSCPICRKDINLQDKNDVFFIQFKLYLTAYRYTLGLFRFVSFISILNFIWLIIFNIYFDYTITYELFKII